MTGTVVPICLSWYKHLWCMTQACQDSDGRALVMVVLGTGWAVFGFSLEQTGDASGSTTGHSGRASLYQVGQRGPEFISWGREGVGSKAGPGKTTPIEPESPWENRYCNFNSRMRYELPLNWRCLLVMWKPKSSLKRWNHYENANDHMVLWATAHHLRLWSHHCRPNGQCTNFQSGPLKWDCSTSGVMPTAVLNNELAQRVQPFLEQRSFHWPVMLYFSML
jgi:hypothetical protein